MVRREWWLLSRDGRDITIRMNHVVAHSCNADPVRLPRLAEADTDQVIFCGHCRVASDQHQPANSRAMATLATTWCFLRSLKRHHCWCSRRLPACPRALRAGSTLAQRARIV